jgi:hypothetical protein
MHGSDDVDFGGAGSPGVLRAVVPVRRGRQCRGVPSGSVGL